MIGSLLLTAAVAGGQPSARPDEPPGAVPTVTVVLPPAPPPPQPPPPPPPTPSDRWAVMRLLQGSWYGTQLDDNRIAVSGWTDLSYNASTASHNNLPMAFDYRANQFMLNQNWLHVEQRIDPQKKEFQWGWVTDWILPGSDYRFTLARGLWDNQLTANRGQPLLYGIDPVQFYAQAFLPGIGEGTTVQLGRFGTPCEYEQNQAVNTPFVSRSYLYTYNPFTHTGLWAVTQLDESWSVGNGLVTGNDTFIDPANRPTYLGQLKWAPKDGPTTVTFNTSVTDPRYDTRQAFPFYNVYNLQLTHKLTDRLSYVLDSAFSHIDGVPGIGSTNWYGAVHYLFYTHTDKLVSTLRAENFMDTDGFRTGFKGLYTEVTYGLSYRPIPSLILRPSVRYDNNDRSAPWEGNQNLFTAAMEVIVRW